MKPRGQEGGEQGDRPAGLHVSRAFGRLLRLGVDDGARQRILGRPPAPRFVIQPGDAVLRVAMQPAPDHIAATIVNLGDHRHGEAAVGEQHHVGAQGNPPDSSPTHVLQLLPLLVRQMHKNHPGHLPPAWRARTVPNL
jgi:hypothetical protein